MMKEGNVILDKSYAFALRTVKLCKYLLDEKKERVLSKQILRSGTSIGANVEEAVGAQSQKDFVSKMSVAYKETRETRYWLRLLTDSSYIDAKLSQSFLSDCEELLKIIGSIQKTMKSRNS
jgi:four helix bundle protein